MIGMPNRIRIVMQFGSKRILVSVVLSILIVTLIVLMSIGVGFFGYLPASIQGTSMEPTLRDGDALFLKRVEAQDINIGDIVALRHINKGQIAHRVVKIEPLLGGDILFQTRGDANQSTEWWHIGAEQKIEVAFLRVRFVGHLLEFSQTLPGLILLFCSGIALLVILTMIIHGYMVHWSEQSDHSGNGKPCAV